MFDTHAIVKNLIAVGVPEKQAEVQVTEFARFITHNAATKVDVAEIRRDTEQLRKETTTSIEQLRKDTTTSIEQLRKETKMDIELLRRDLTIRMGGIVTVGTGVILAAIAALKLL